MPRRTRADLPVTEPATELRREICAVAECYEPLAPDDDLLCAMHLAEWLTESDDTPNPR